jgi:stearoyl-CoA desaturase (delta-9 desaturase)
MSSLPHPDKQQTSNTTQSARSNSNTTNHAKKTHITDEAITLGNWYKHINWLNITLVIGVPIYGLIQSFWVPLHFKTAFWAVVYYFMCGLGITAGILLVFIMSRT